jgi:hypothetical protein
MTRDGEQPWAKARVDAKATGMHHEPEPSLFNEIFGHVPTVGQSRQEVVQAAIEGIVHDLERVTIACPQTFDKPELTLAIHPR